MTFPKLTPQQIKKYLEETADKVIFFDNMDDAIVGFVKQFNNYLVVYDYEKTIECFQKQGMSYEEAVEWISFNVTGAWLGEHTPVFINTDDLEELTQ
jgi:hypothetical protein